MALAMLHCSYNQGAAMFWLPGVETEFFSAFGVTGVG